MLIQEYQAHWKEDFRAISEAILEALGNLHITIEHIGSTAVPRLAAKPIIDIDVVYANSEEFEEIKLRLERVGYFHNGNQGIPQREVFKRIGTTDVHKTLDSIAHHLYVCPTDSEELQRHILLRDYLIENEAARRDYQNLKYEIANEVCQDRKKYAELKEVKAKKFIEAMIAKAQEEKIRKSLPQ